MRGWTFRKKTERPSEPPLLSLRGRIDHQVLQDEIAAIEHGEYPEWRIVRDTRSDGSANWRHTLAALLGAIFGMFNQPSSAPGRTIVVEHTPTNRQATVRFDYLGEANGLPLWTRG